MSEAADPGEVEYDEVGYAIKRNSIS